MQKILIIDDEPLILSTMAELIDLKTPYEVDKASNGLDAFLMAQERQYDLIITDHKMPFMTGAAFIIACRTKKNKNEKTPIVMLSSFIDDSLKETLKISNVSFMEKPFTSDKLIAAIRKYFL